MPPFADTRRLFYAQPAGRAAPNTAILHPVAPASGNRTHGLNVWHLFEPQANIAVGGETFAVWRSVTPQHGAQLADLAFDFFVQA